MISNIWLMYSFLTPERPRWFQVAVIGAAVVAHLSLRKLLTPLGLDPFLIGYILAVLYLVLAKLIFKESMPVKFFIVCMVLSLSQFNFLFMLFLEELAFDHMTSALVLSGQLLELCSIPLIRRYIGPHIKNMLEVLQAQSRIFILFPFFSFLLLAFYGIQRAYLLTIFIPLVLSTVVIAIAYYLITIAIIQTKSQQLLEQQMALQRDHYRNLNDSINETRRLRHDMRQHLVMILELLGKNDAVGAQEYLKKLCDFYDDSALPSVCRNQSADALICYYLKLAKQKNIKFTTKLHIPEESGVQDMDLCVILGNALENSIEACCKISDCKLRFIEMKAGIAKGHMVIQIVNSFAGSICPSLVGAASSKAGADHGIGINSMKMVAGKYQGQCDFSLTDQVFKLAVSLKIPGNSALCGENIC